LTVSTNRIAFVRNVAEWCVIVITAVRLLLEKELVRRNVVLLREAFFLASSRTSALGMVEH